MNPNIFREYDIRGRVPDDLNPQAALEMGRAFGTYFHDRRARKIGLGRDCRLSSPELRRALLEGMMESGMDVIEVGMVPTPLLYFALHHLDLEGGVQITASHNPSEYNGFKICLGKTTIYGREIQEIRKIGESGRFCRGSGSEEERDVVEPYLEFLRKNIHPGNIRRKVVVDAGNGTAGIVAPDAYEAMGAEVEKLYCDPDGRFPNHHPDPTIPGNLKVLAERVRETSADLGIGFDGDADRIGVMDAEGRVIWGDQLMIVFSRDVLERHPGGKIIGEVKCSQVLYRDIEKRGGKPIMWKTGHSLIKDKMKKEGALIAGEMSGHMFFGDRYFGYDDAIYAGARLLEILSRTEKGLRDLLAGVPEMINTPEIRVECPDEEKFRIVEALTQEFKKSHRVIDVDGARVLFQGGWGLVRASNTQPVLVLRYEAENEETLERIRQTFESKLKKHICAT